MSNFAQVQIDFPPPYSLIYAHILLFTDLENSIPHPNK